MSTILGNGPLGVFEIDPFGEGTKELAEASAASNAFSIAGAGDTLAAIEKHKVFGSISCISTCGGAFLEVLEGKKLPAVAIGGWDFSAHPRPAIGPKERLPVNFRFAHPGQPRVYDFRVPSGSPGRANP